jgi:ketosteroid isomerase-like protein
VVSVGVIERMYAALEEEGVEGLLGYIHPEFEGVVSPELSAEPDVYRGHAGMRRWFDGFEGLEDVRLSPEDFIGDGERVLVPVVLSARGAGSGIEVEQRVVQGWTVRDGLAVRVESFVDMESARREEP